MSAKKQEPTSESSKRYNKLGTHSSLIKNYEIRLRGRWFIPVMPFSTKDCFVCYEEDTGTTTIGARLTVGKTRKEMAKVIIGLQCGLLEEHHCMSTLQVDEQPLLRSHPRWSCIKKTHFTHEVITDVYIPEKENHTIFWVKGESTKRSCMCAALVKTENTT